MSHAIYQTPAIVLRVKPMRESNKLAVLYTRDFGVVYVGAQSIREQASKMKAHLQYLSLVDVDLVRGREIWRLTGIHENHSSLSFVKTSWYSLFDRITSVIDRLCQGEEPHHDIWDDVEMLYGLAMKGNEPHDTFEIITLSRILNTLGYWSGIEQCVTTDDPYGDDSRAFAQQHKKMLVQKINEGLKQSQL